MKNNSIFVCIRKWPCFYLFGKIIGIDDNSLLILYCIHPILVLWISILRKMSDRNKSEQNFRSIVSLQLYSNTSTSSNFLCYTESPYELALCQDHIIPFTFDTMSSLSLLFSSFLLVRFSIHLHSSQNLHCHSSSLTFPLPVFPIILLFLSREKKWREIVDYTFLGGSRTTVTRWISIWSWSIMSKLTVFQR